MGANTLANAALQFCGADSDGGFHDVELQFRSKAELGLKATLKHGIETLRKALSRFEKDVSTSGCGLWRNRVVVPRRIYLG